MSDNSPCVSVVIPAFNAAETVGAAVESALGQTLTDIEVIVVDDGSTDDTLARLAAINDSRLRVVRADHRGVAHTRNTGLDHARGEFITFLDADDLWAAGKLQAQVEKIASNPAVWAVYSWTMFMDQRGRYLFAKAPQYCSGDVYAELLVTFSLASGSNVLARRECIEAIGRFDESAQPVEDWEYWLRAAKAGQFAAAPSHQVFYRFTRGSSSAAVEAYLCAIERVAKRAFAEAPPALQARYGECLSNAKQHACLLYLVRTTAPDAHRRAGRLLRAAIWQHPAALTSARTIALLCGWLALFFVPRSKMTDAAFALLRCYGYCANRPKRAP